MGRDRGTGDRLECARARRGRQDTSQCDRVIPVIIVSLPARAQGPGSTLSVSPSSQNFIEGFAQLSLQRFQLWLRQGGRAAGDRIPVVLPFSERNLVPNSLWSGPMLALGFGLTVGRPMGVAGIGIGIQ